MPDLITLSRATELVPNFPSADNAVMQDIVSACSDLIKRYCNRDFVLTTYDELYDGPGHINLLLDQYPIVSITRIAFAPTQMLMIRNSDTDCSRAMFRLDGTSDQPSKPNALYLTTMKNGIETTRTIQIDGNGAMLTYGNLADAINGYSADGWVALALGIYGTWALADLRPPQGGMECRWQGASYLVQHFWNLPAYNFNQSTGEIVAPQGFQRGYQNYRVVYQAGYATVPTPVQQACAELASAVYLQRNTNPNLQSETLGEYSYTNAVEKTFNSLSIASRYALSLYKNTRLAKFKPW